MAMGLGFLGSPGKVTGVSYCVGKLYTAIEGYESLLYTSANWVFEDFKDGLHTEGPEER